MFIVQRFIDQMALFSPFLIDASMGGIISLFLSCIVQKSVGERDIDQGLANAFLAIGSMLLVLKIPQMLSTWALHPAADGSNAPGERSEDSRPVSGEGDEGATGSISSTESSTATSTTLLTGSDAAGFTGASSVTSGGSTAAAGGDAAAAALLV